MNTPMKVRAKKTFQVGPKAMGLFPVFKRDICEVLCHDEKGLCVKTARAGTFFGVCSWSDWEIVNETVALYPV